MRSVSQIHFASLFVAALVAGQLRAQGTASQPTVDAPDNLLSLDPEQPARRPVDGIRDNSFLIEEAYNQEPGVVQHISFARFGIDERGTERTRSWNLGFIQEWPLFSQTHQLSYTLAYSFVDTKGQGEHDSDIGDTLLNYRYQLLNDEGPWPAIAPRISLILPTGDEDRGFGDGVTGYQFNLPMSKTLTDRLYVNFNIGFTHLPNVQRRLSDGKKSSEYDLLDFNLGGSVIYAVTDTFNLMLEATWNAGQNIEERNSPLEKRLLIDRGPIHEVAISPGVRWALNLPGDLQIVPGLAFPIGLTSDTVDYGVFFYFSIEHPYMAVEKH